MNESQSQPMDFIDGVFYSRSKRDIARIVPQILAGAEGQYFPRVQNPIWGVLFEGAASIKQGQHID